jgi:hypothetical protein
MKLTVREEAIEAGSSIANRNARQTAEISFDTVPMAGSRFTVGQADFLISSVKDDHLTLTRVFQGDERNKQIRVELGKNRLYRPQSHSGYQYRILYSEPE